jgi:anthranilate phosphoribosyltransferase
VTDTFKGLIGKVATGATLTREEASGAFEQMMSGEATPSQMGALLMVRCRRAPARPTCSPRSASTSA